MENVVIRLCLPTPCIFIVPVRIDFEEKMLYGTNCMIPFTKYHESARKSLFFLNITHLILDDDFKTVQLAYVFNINRYSYLTWCRNCYAWWTGHICKGLIIENTIVDEGTFFERSERITMGLLRMQINNLEESLNPICEKICAVLETTSNVQSFASIRDSLKTPIEDLSLLTLALHRLRLSGHIAFSSIIIQKHKTIPELLRTGDIVESKLCLSEQKIPTKPLPEIFLLESSESENVEVQEHINSLTSQTEPVIEIELEKQIPIKDEVESVIVNGEEIVYKDLKNIILNGLEWPYRASIREIMKEALEHGYDLKF